MIVTFITWLYNNAVVCEFSWRELQNKRETDFNNYSYKDRSMMHVKSFA